MIRNPVFWPEDLTEGKTAYIAPWNIRESNGKFYILVNLNLSLDPIGSLVAITRQNGNIVIGKGYETPTHVDFTWLSRQGYEEVTLS